MTRHYFKIIKEEKEVIYSFLVYTLCTGIAEYVGNRWLGLPFATLIVVGTAVCRV